MLFNSQTIEKLVTELQEKYDMEVYHKYNAFSGKHSIIVNGNVYTYRTNEGVCNTLMLIMDNYTMG